MAATGGNRPRTATATATATATIPYLFALYHIPYTKPQLRLIPLTVIQNTTMLDTPLRIRKTRHFPSHPDAKAVQENFTSRQVVCQTQS
eukprot:scaffold575_cov186-Amphora_coffeaeformis.AAC.9